ncbi:nuclear transport factor 2 family protein [Novosphingobium sp.]|uniref:nuclear transport factor 2 family protein n=1 Tax=Novosphingobium sp. TaxID=1874826 RepID=UPI0035B27099
MIAQFAITNLLYRYAEMIDAGDLAGAAALFGHARIKMRGGEELDSAALLASWRRRVVLHPCGTPRTRHVVTNPIIEVDEAAGTATCRSCYTVLQQTETLPLQVIAAGRYLDTFARVDGEWRFASRDYSLFDMPGDLSQHLSG